MGCMIQAAVADTGCHQRSRWPAYSQARADRQGSGHLPGFPRATCELQGCAYDAKIRGARLARNVWKDPEYADQLETQAADLKRRFNSDFWIVDRQYYALASDGDGSQVDVLSSNIGHLR